EWQRNQVFTTSFTLSMFMVHVLAGVILVAPYLIFGGIHLAMARTRRNRRAVKLGIMLFLARILGGLTGLAPIPLHRMLQLATGTAARFVVYLLHAAFPVVAVWLYVLHRRAGPKIRWHWGIAWSAAVGVFVAAMCLMHAQDPRKWYAQGSPDGEKYFEP